jgi:hypothetical protein
MKFTEVSDFTLGPYKSRKIELLEPWQFQTPKMYVPFGISGFEPDFGPKKWNIDFALKGYDTPSSYMKKFYEFLKGIENKVIEHVHQNSFEIFGSEQSLEEVREMFQSNIKEDRRGQHPPNFRLKVDVDADENIVPQIFDANNNDVTGPVATSLYSRQMCTAVAEFCSVYFMNKKFGIVWKLHQLKVHPPAQQKLTGFLFT